MHGLVREQLRDPTLAPGLLFAQPVGPYYERALTLGCPVIAADLPHGHSAGRIRDLSAQMRPFDVHHFHSAETLMMLASLRVRARRVYTHRAGLTAYPLRRRMRYTATGLLLRHRFHGFSGNTAEAARAAATLFRIDAARFRVTYNTIDPTALVPQRSATQVRDDLGLAEADPVIGTIAHFRPWKRLDRLLHAVSALNTPEIRLVLVGDGPDRARLEALADQLEIRSQVVFTGWVEHPGDMLQIMHVFSLPSSRAESFGNAVVEAMAVGLPAVVFEDAGGMVEHIDDGRTGYIVDGQAQFEQRVGALLTDPGLRSRMGEAARAGVRTKYTPAASAAAYRSLYDSLPGE